MFRFILPTILLGLGVASFLMYTNPTYKEIQTLKVEQASYDEALTNSKKLEEKKSALIKKLGSFSEEDIGRLERLLPDNVDNIKLIIEINDIASQYGGMQLQNIKYDTLKDTTTTTATTTTKTKVENKDYGTFNLEFSIVGNYQNFILFLKDLEKSLRIVDIDSISFSSVAGKDTTKYDFKIKTYWLKN